jgi:hypothetical protein
MKLGFLRRNVVTFALLILVLAISAPTVVHAVDEVIDGNLVFTGPNQGGAKDIRTSNTDGGLRIFNGQTLSPIPEGAAIQFFGNGSASYPGQAFIDSGAHNNAALIFRTAGAGQGITERMRVSAAGNVGIGTATPNSTLQVVGNFIQIPHVSSIPVPTDCDAAAEVGRMVLVTGIVPLLYACNNVGTGTFAWAAAALGPTGPTGPTGPE